jgi:hypothetical protein
MKFSFGTQSVEDGSTIHNVVKHCTETKAHQDIQLEFPDQDSDFFLSNGNCISSH